MSVAAAAAAIPAPLAWTAAKVERRLAAAVLASQCGDVAAATRGMAFLASCLKLVPAADRRIVMALAVGYSTRTVAAHDGRSHETCRQAHRRALARIAEQFNAAEPLD